MTDVMVDIETLGTKQGNVILSIGAVVFNPFGTGPSLKKQFYRRIDLFDSLLHGFQIEQSTLKWWQAQDAAARSELTAKPCVTVADALGEFQQWFYEVGGEKFWCQGATFDAPLLQEYYERLKIQTPWQFWAVRDTRTVYDICGYDYQSAKRAGVFHNALDDAIHQIDCVQTALKSFALGRLV